MFFKKFENGEPVGDLIKEQNLRHVLFDVDFDKNPPAAFWETKGYCVVIITDKPVTTPYQLAVENLTKNEDNTWQQNWQIVDVSENERQRIFDEQLKKVQDHQKELLNNYATQLADPDETPTELMVIQHWVDATNAMDLSDPFNVKWPNLDTVAPKMNDLLIVERQIPESNLTTVRTI